MVEHRTVVRIPHPDSRYQFRCITHGPVIAEVGSSAGFYCCGSPDVKQAELAECAQARFVVIEDVGDQICDAFIQYPRAATGLPSLDDLSVRARNFQDGRGWDAQTAARKHAVSGNERAARAAGLRRRQAPVPVQSGPHPRAL